MDGIVRNPLAAVILGILTCFALMAAYRWDSTDTAVIEAQMANHIRSST